jgi:hypothetical protein
VSPELARQKYSAPILRELQRIADPHGQDKLEFAQIDIHSKGLLAVSSLLKDGSLAASNVTAYGPAVGNDFWALDNLSAYAADRQPGSVTVKVNPNDPVPRATPLQLGIGADLAEHVKTQKSRVNVVPVAMPGVEGIAGHYLENYLLFEKMNPEELARRRAAVSGSQKSSWLLGVAFKLERMREKAIQDIRKYEGEIQKCNGTIAKSDVLVRQARQKGNAKVETIAQEAVARAKEARTRNMELKTAAERRKQRAEYSLAHTQNALADATGSPRKIQSVLSDFSGRVSIQKANGEIIEPGGSQPPFLELGDSLVTYGNSSAELQCMDGRGTMKAGEFSRVRMEEDEP